MRPSACLSHQPKRPVQNHRQSLRCQQSEACQVCAGRGQRMLCITCCLFSSHKQTNTLRVHLQHQEGSSSCSQGQHSSHGVVNGRALGLCSGCSILGGWACCGLGCVACGGAVGLLSASQDFLQARHSPRSSTHREQGQKSETYLLAAQVCW